MNEPTNQPIQKPQPLRLNVQLSFIVESETEALVIYEEIGTFAKGVNAAVIIGGQIMKMFGPCCGQKGAQVKNV